MELYLHSIEASHYPLVECGKCGVLMEREDCHEHAMAACDPGVEGGFFVEAMKKQMKAKLEATANEKIPDGKSAASKQPSAKSLFVAGQR